MLNAFNNGIRCEKLKNCFVHPDRGKADAVEASVGKNVIKVIRKDAFKVMVVYFGDFFSGIRTHI